MRPSSRGVYISSSPRTANQPAAEQGECCWEIRQQSEAKLAKELAQSLASGRAHSLSLALRRLRRVHSVWRRALITTNWMLPNAARCPLAELALGRPQAAKICRRWSRETRVAQADIGSSASVCIWRPILSSARLASDNKLETELRGEKGAKKAKKNWEPITHLLARLVPASCLVLTCLALSSWRRRRDRKRLRAPTRLYRPTVAASSVRTSPNFGPGSPSSSVLPLAGAPSCFPSHFHFNFTCARRLRDEFLSSKFFHFLQTLLDQVDVKGYSSASC